MPSAEGDQRKKKRKRERTEQFEADVDERTKKPAKKRAGHGFPNPGEDPSLTDQARKALAYAYAQFDDPSSWKFNKARQNWLIRNIWSDQAIPDAHVPLLLRYLADVKGGVRENLVKTCNGALASSDPPSQESAQTAEETAGNGSLKQTRARAILDVISLPGNVDQVENS